MLNIEERFFTKTKMATEVRPGMDTPCLEWQAFRNKGYGVFRVSSSRVDLAHRVAWEIAHGCVPGGMGVLHRCDNPACVNADHLFLGTQRDNVADMLAKGRRGIFVGSANGRAKLTELDVRRVWNLHRSGWTGKRIASELGVGQSRISGILTRKNWAHVNA